MAKSVDQDRDPLPLALVGWAISLAIFFFGAYGYVTNGLESGQLPGFILATALGGIMQAGAAVGAKAIRRSKNFELDASKILSGVMVATGALFTGYTVHNAFDATGMLDGGDAAAIAWLISYGVPIFEFSVWWVDESLESEASAIRAKEIQEDTAPRALLWTDAPALDVEGLSILAQTDPVAFERVRPWLSRAFAKANHIARRIA